MGKNGAEEIKSGILTVVENQELNQNSEQNPQVAVVKTTTEVEVDSQNQQHPYAFHVSGPRNVPSINWRDLINSTWLVFNLHLLKLPFIFNLHVYVCCYFDCLL